MTNREKHQHITQEPETREQGSADEQSQALDDPIEEELNEVIESLCVSKAAEFRMLGYSQVTSQDIWNCVSEQYSGDKAFKLHEVVNDILSLKAVRFMNWLMMRAYKLEDI